MFSASILHFLLFFLASFPLFSFISPPVFLLPTLACFEGRRDLNEETHPLPRLFSVPHLFFSDDLTDLDKEFSILLSYFLHGVYRDLLDNFTMSPLNTKKDEKEETNQVAKRSISDVNGLAEMYYDEQVARGRKNGGG